MPTIAIVNQSSVMTDAELQAVARALDVQVARDFSPQWRTAAVVFKPAAEVQPADWVCSVKDTTDQPGALGYHDVSGGDVPRMYVFAATCRQNGVNPSTTISHEVLEALGDPLIELCAQQDARTLYAFEACDAVEQSSYPIDDPQTGQAVEVSNFVLPAWFQPGNPGPWDHLGKLTSAGDLLPGGSYIGVGTASASGITWSQRNADGSTSTGPDPDRPQSCLRPFQRGRAALI